ncbi:glycine cleavage system protein GcvH [bacterium 210820-DFI.6.37]|nr:glycine cleavage system protein GcvH [bacterium 210820-DFI.6.37]
MNFPKELKYSKTHEWVKMVDDTTALIGLTDYAQSELGDLVFINLPEEDDELSVEESFADVESVKAVSDVVAPLAGTVSEINEELMDEPQRINTDPYDAWLVKVSDVSQLGELMDADGYAAFVESLQEEKLF